MYNTPRCNIFQTQRTLSYKQNDTCSLQIKKSVVPNKIEYNTNQGNDTKYHKMLQIHCIFRMHGNVYINISTTIRNCSNNHYTNKIAWGNATHQVVTRLWEPGTSTKVHNKHSTAGTKDYLIPPRDKDNMTNISGGGRNVIPPSGGQHNDGQERMSRDNTNTGNHSEEDNINAADSSNDEPVLACHIVIQSPKIKSFFGESKNY